MRTVERWGGRRRAIVAGALVASLVAGSPAAAAADGSVEVQLSLGIAPLAGAVRDESYAVPLGLAVLVRAGRFLGGPALTLTEGEGALRERGAYLGIALGGSLELAEGWRLALLGEGGIHHVFEVWEDRYTSRDAALFPDWSVALRRSVDLPYLGGRAGVSWERRHDRSWEMLWSRSQAVGLFVFARGDLARGTATVDYAPFQLLCLGACVPPTTSRYAVGGLSAGVGFEVSARW